MTIRLKRIRTKIIVFASREELQLPCPRRLSSSILVIAFPPLRALSVQLEHVYKLEFQYLLYHVCMVSKLFYKNRDSCKSICLRLSNKHRTVLRFRSLRTVYALISHRSSFLLHHYSLLISLTWQPMNLRTESKVSEEGSRYILFLRVHEAFRRSRVSNRLMISFSFFFRAYSSSSLYLFFLNLLLFFFSIFK